ncbi:MAG: MBL fold metallo-hydrolase [Clostridia bacterium]|nr:MAG: MBL fold metallo-hydrolase [Clostridia bacterium]
MQLEVLEVGPAAANCYLVICQVTGRAAVIDPGGEPGRILAAVEKHKAQVEYIINTHGHADHIAADAAIKEATGAPLLIHAEDAAYLTDTRKSLLLYLGQDKAGPEADRLLEEGDIINIGAEVTLEVLHTPGHTPGGMCLKGEGFVFTGDTLFAGSVGRTDFPGGSFSSLIASIRDKLLPLDDSTRVYPGHGPESTIGVERATNPFLL